MTKLQNSPLPWHSWHAKRRKPRINSLPNVQINSCPRYATNDAMEDPQFMPDTTNIHGQEILLAASQHDLTTLRDLLRLYSFPEYASVDIQDPETGLSPLHAAIAACDTEEENHVFVEGCNSGHENAREVDTYTAATNGLSPRQGLVERAKETVRCLLQNGAIWNQLDQNKETPGCLALRLGFKELYHIMVDAGVRAEMLLNRLEEYQKLEDEEDDAEAPMDDDLKNCGEVDSAKGAEYRDVTNEQYLSSTLSFSADRLLDDQQNGVMMSWESGIMSRSADAILPAPGLRLLNIGFGMGVIDSYIDASENKPSSHHIVEAHPAVLADMRAKGWHEKSGVVIHEGKWQDVLPQLVTEEQVFDAIYFDTFAESYSHFREFFSEHVNGLLDPDGTWSFFNGMGADRQISYDVYQKVVEMDLFEAGFDVEWQGIDVPVLDAEWEGVKRKYWNVARYRLPVCSFMD